MSASTRHRRRRPVAWLAAAGVVAGLTGPAAAGPAPAAPAPTTPSPASSAVYRHPAQVTLPTGERLTLRWTGDVPQIVARPGDSVTSVLTVGQHVYAIPAEAKPYLGATLDRSLFDVTALAAVEGSDGTGTIPVSLAYAGAPVDVPGVRVTGPSGSRATGLVDSPAAFGAALRNRLHSDPAGARRAGTPVPGLTRLTLIAASEPSATSVHPDFDMVTLTVNVAAPVGRTVTGIYAMVVNTDDTRKYGNFTEIGPESYAKISVPKGHYAIVADVSTARPDGTPGPELVPIAVDYAVRGAGQSVTLDPNQATASATYSTPQASELLYRSTDIQPSDGVHPPTTYFRGFPDTVDPPLIQPTPRSRYGQLAFDAWEARSATAPDGTPFQYKMATDWTQGIPADLHQDLRAGQFAHVEDTFYPGGAAGDRTTGRGPIFPGLRGGVYISPSTSVHSTDYLYGSSDVRWLADAYQFTGAAFDSGEQEVRSTLKQYAPGGTYAVNWFQGALRSGFQSARTAPDLYCIACRTSTGMLVRIASTLDSDPDHYGAAVGGDADSSRMAVSQDGTPIAQSDYTDPDYLKFPVPAEDHEYRIEDTVDRAAMGFTTSTKLHTVYTVHSSSTSGKPVPANWDCYAPGDGACTVLPLLTANVPLRTSLDETMPVGPATFVVRVGHVAGAATSPITGLTFATSLDGTTFAPTTVVDLGGGRYRVTLDNPAVAVGQHVSIQLHAEDATGGSLTQTVTDGYTISGS